MGEERKDTSKSLSQAELLDALRKEAAKSNQFDLPSLEELLAGSDRSDFWLADEDREWVHAVPVGRECLEN